MAYRPYVASPATLNPEVSRQLTARQRAQVDAAMKQREKRAAKRKKAAAKSKGKPSTTRQDAQRAAEALKGTPLSRVGYMGEAMRAFKDATGPKDKKNDGMN